MWHRTRSVDEKLAFEKGANSFFPRRGGGGGGRRKFNATTHIVSTESKLFLFDFFCYESTSFITRLRTTWGLLHTKTSNLLPGKSKIIFVLYPVLLTSESSEYLNLWVRRERFYLITDTVEFLA